MVGGDLANDADAFDYLIGKRIVAIEFWTKIWNEYQHRWVWKKTAPGKNEGCVTLVFNDGTRLQGVDGEYGINRMEIFKIVSCKKRKTKRVEP